MPRTISYTCSGCSTPKMETNHWFVVTNAKGGFTLNTWSWAVEEHILDEDSTQHLCGRACAVKMFSQFLEEVSKGETNV